MFCQVEADSAQLDLNNRFQLFFPEKRLFFLEGADFFSTPLDLVFTRTIADPRWGAKLTGTEGHHAFGLSVAQDAVTGIMLPGYESDDCLGLSARHVRTIGRYRLDIGSRGSTIGALRRVHAAGGRLFTPTSTARRGSISFPWRVRRAVVLLGYSDSAIGDRTVDLTRANRTLFLKVGYAWLF